MSFLVANLLFGLIAGNVWAGTYRVITADILQSGLTDNIKIPELTASQAVCTDASSNLVSLAYSSSRGASSLMKSDSNSNLSVNEIIPAGSALATASLPVSLTSASAQFQTLTGSATGTLTLPSGTAGQFFIIQNSSTAVVSVNKPASTLLVSLQGGQGCLFFYNNSDWHFMLLPQFNVGDTKNNAPIRGTDGSIIIDHLVLDGFYTGADADLSIYASSLQSGAVSFTFPASATAGYFSSDGSGNMSLSPSITVNNGQIISNQTTAPTATVKSGAGTGGSCSVSHATDTAGVIALTTTAVSPASGAQCDINFNSSYSVAPICFIQSVSATTVAQTILSQVYMSSTTAKLSVNFGSADNVGHSYSWNYLCVETQ